MIYVSLLGCFFFLMILYPSITFEGACNGLILWFQTVLPTLLPLAIISNLLIATNGIHFISRYISKLFYNFFHVSSSGSYAVLIGFLCGYPMGAKTIDDLVRSHHISPKEGQYLLSFCNNTSPMFIIGYLVLQNFQDKKLLLPSLIILMATPILCSFFFRSRYRNKELHFAKTIQKSNGITFHFELFDQAILNGFETLTKVGGYIVLFSILLLFAKQLPHSTLFAFLEITNGIPCILETNFSFEIQFILCLALVSFGGLCSVLQTRAMIQNSGLSIRPYIKEKLITAMVTSFISYVYIYLIRS